MRVLSKSAIGPKLVLSPSHEEIKRNRAAVTSALLALYKHSMKYGCELIQINPLQINQKDFLSVCFSCTDNMLFAPPVVDGGTAPTAVADPLPLHAGVTEQTSMFTDF